MFRADERLGQVFQKQKHSGCGETKVKSAVISRGRSVLPSGLGDECYLSSDLTIKSKSEFCPSDVID